MSDIHNLLRHEDELADGLAGNPLLGIGMREDSGLYFVRGGIGWDVDGEAHLTADLDGVFDGAFNEVLFFALGPGGVADGGGVAELVPELFGDVWSKGSNEH